MNVALKPNPADLTETQALHMAKLAEAAERYEEMTQYMNRSVADIKGDDLTVEQRNLISVGYKNLMSARRTAWRVTQQQVDSDDDFKEQGEKYKEKIADELGELINDVRTKVVDKFVKGPHAATDNDVLVFFHKVAPPTRRLVDRSGGEACRVCKQPLKLSLDCRMPARRGPPPLLP